MCHKRKYYNNTNIEMFIQFLLMTDEGAEAAYIRLTVFVLAVASSLQANVVRLQLQNLKPEHCPAKRMLLQRHCEEQRSAELECSYRKFQLKEMKHVP
jgi:hypothetical protein